MPEYQFICGTQRDAWQSLTPVDAIHGCSSEKSKDIGDQKREKKPWPLIVAQPKEH